MAVVTKAHTEHLALINQARAAAGLRALRFSQVLHDAADHKARSMANEDYFSHTEPNGRSARKLLIEYGYPTTAWTGENILYGVDSPTEAFEMWWDSLPHRENMMNPVYTEIGIALGVEPEWSFSNDVYKVGVQEFGSGTTPEARLPNGQLEPVEPKRPKRYEKPYQPTLPRSRPPVKERANGIIGKVEEKIHSILRRRKR